MKRIFFAVAAICSMSLWSCDNDLDNNELTPVEQEMLKLDEMIASQSGFDKTALLADLTSGTMIEKDQYCYMSDGSLIDAYEDLVGGELDAHIVFFEDGIGKYYYTHMIPYAPYYCDNFTWRYDSSTGSLITHQQGYQVTYEGEYVYYDECSAKVLYYNSEDHCLILEGSFFCAFSIRNAVKTRLIYEIDLDPATRERVLGLCDNE